MQQSQQNMSRHVYSKAQVLYGGSQSHFRTVNLRKKIEQSDDPRYMSSLPQHLLQASDMAAHQENNFMGERPDAYYSDTYQMSNQQQQLEYQEEAYDEELEEDNDYESEEE